VTGTPPVRRRLLGAALRRYREALGYGLEDAARILDCDRSKISRIETGQRGIRVKELRELLSEYGVPDEEQAGLVAVAHRGRQHGWWQDYPDVLTDVRQDYVMLEAVASEILAYEPQQVPDLLQTADYARAVADADPAFSSDDQRAHAVEVKLTRQQIVVGERPPRFDVVLSESVLHHAVGAAGVMRTQLAALAAIASRSEDSGELITLRVLPFAAGACAAAGTGPMTILRFSKTPTLGVIHLATLSGGISLEDQEDVSRYLRAFAQLRGSALTPVASARLLRQLTME
jgi:transcriptional regulator with XRE-family HTH domain